MSMINGTRLYDHLTRLGQIGFVPKEGTTRLPYTPAYDEGRIYVQQCMEQAGLQTSVDPVGTLIGTLPGQGEIICIGSHIDTVPGGGIYDGTYGVLSGIECVQRLKELGYQNRHPIQVIAFTEEEPADSPAIVILSGSPPNFSMFALTQSRALSWSRKPYIPVVPLGDSEARFSSA